MSSNYERSRYRNRNDMSSNYERNRNRNNNTNNSRLSRNENISMNYNQRLLLDTYLNMYNSTSRQIDALYDNLNEIKHNIDFIVGIERDEFVNEVYNNENNDNLRHNNTLNEIHHPNITRISNYTNLHTQQPSVPILNNVNHMVDLILNYITPTSVEISQATRDVRYNEIENPINDRCPISHELFQDNDDVTQIIFCGHIFTPGEINTWFQRNSHCPVCRHNILSNTENTSNSNSENVGATGGNAVASDTNTNTNTNTNVIPSINEILNNYGYDISNNYVLFETVYRRFN